MRDRARARNSVPLSSPTTRRLPATGVGLALRSTGPSKRIAAMAPLAKRIDAEPSPINAAAKSETSGGMTDPGNFLVLASPGPSQNFRPNPNRGRSETSSRDLRPARADAWRAKSVVCRQSEPAGLVGKSMSARKFRVRSADRAILGEIASCRRPSKGRRSSFGYRPVIAFFGPGGAAEMM